MTLLFHHLHVLTLCLFFFRADVFEEFFSPVTAAQAFLNTVISTRKEVLQKTMGFVMQVLTSPNLDPRQKAGALHMVGSVADVLLKVGKHSSCSGMLASHQDCSWSHAGTSSAEKDLQRPSGNDAGQSCLPRIPEFTRLPACEGM